MEVELITALPVSEAKRPLVDGNVVVVLIEPLLIGAGTGLAR